MVNNEFICRMKRRKEIEEWPAKITRIVNHGSHYEIKISSRSSITVIFGKSQQGGFCCIPDWKVGCHLAKLTDLHWNLERLTAAMKKDKVDAVTVAYALAFMGKLLEDEQ